MSAENRVSWVAPRVARAALDRCPPEVETALESVLKCSRDAIALDMGGRLPLWIPITCDRKYCRHCSTRWSDQLTAEARKAVLPIPPRELRHLVLTVPNARLGGLEERTNQLYKAFREWRNQGRRSAHGSFWRPVEGYMSKLEIDLHETTTTTTNKRTGRRHTYRPGWHPHLHVLLHVPRGFDLREGSEALASWRRLIAPITGTACAPWITKPASARAAAIEVAKYAAKPLQIECAKAPSLTELALAVQGRRFVASQGTLAVSLSNPPADCAPIGTLSETIRTLLGRDTTTTPEQARLARVRVESYIHDPSIPAATKLRAFRTIAKRLNITLAEISNYDRTSRTRRPRAGVQ
jgi:hypothetical protein